MPDLTQNAFQIFEDGVQQTITQFTHERVPLGLGLLLDVSDSMFGQRILDARAAVERFLLELLAPTDAYFVMAFNHEPHAADAVDQRARRASVRRSPRCTPRAAPPSTTRSPARCRSWIIGRANAPRSS